MKKKQAVTQKTLPNEILRFAHPFFTETPIEQRSIVNGIGTRMTDYVQTLLEPIPDPIREPTMMLAEIIGESGVAEIEKTGMIKFHAVGDTGLEVGNAEQMVADIMTEDYKINKPEKSPAFFLHLGDANYYDNTDTGYHAQFYVPYKTYPGKIIAIPGNHDGELFKYDGTSSGQTVTLEAFQKNFCQPVTGVPPAAGTIYREMISQPAVYWYLDMPFADIVGLYSNVAENPGYISGPTIGTAQKDWFTKTLTNIKAARDAGNRKALLIATHHPPFSSGSHSSSTDMLIDIDDSCTQAGIMPDVVFSAHSHNIQCYTRYITFGGKDIQIPFIVCGGGGRPPQAVTKAKGTKVKDLTTIESYHTFDKSIDSLGYLMVSVTKSLVKVDIYSISEAGKKTHFDSIKVNL